MSAMPPIAPGTGLPPNPTEPFPPISPGPPNNRLPGWATGDMSDVRQQLLEGLQVDLASPSGLPLIKVGKATRRGSGYVWGPINPVGGIAPGLNQHDILRTELSGGVLATAWGQMHLADMPGGSPNLVFVEDGSGLPALALLLNANVDAAADIAWSKFAPNHAAKAFMGNLAGIASGVLTAIFFQTSFGSTSNYVLWSSASALQAQIAGTYRCTAGIAWPANVTGYRNCDIYINGATPIASDSRMAVTTAGVGTNQTLTAIVQLAAGDFMQLLVTQNSGVALVGGSADHRTYIAMEYLGHL